MRLEGTSNMMIKFNDRQRIGVFQGISVSFRKHGGAFRWLPQYDWNAGLGSGYILWGSFRIGARV